MSTFYKGELIFDENPDPSSFNAACDFLEKYYNCRLFTDEYELEGAESAKRVVIPRHIPFLFSGNKLPYLPDYLRDLQRELRDEEQDDLHMLYIVDVMERLFHAKATYERIEPSISDPDLLREFTELNRRTHWSQRFLSHEEPTQSEPSRKRKERRIDEGALEAALAELDALIGLESVKQQIRDIVSIVRNRGAEGLPCLHMLFTGNPGTGKTEVARILGRVLAALGVTEDANRFVEADRSTLVAKYVGHTAIQTKKVIKKAMGGVLFIDEAYSLGLYWGSLGASLHGDGGRHDFGPEAIDALVKEMEDHRGEFVCIMAGYPREMEAMVSLNPGLRDRIGFKIEFPDYDVGELSAIFEKMVEDRGYRLSMLAKELAGERVAHLGRGRGYDFGNARLMRKIAERAIFKQNVRTTGDIIAREDIEAAFADGDLAELEVVPRQTIGFCA